MIQLRFYLRCLALPHTDAYLDGPVDSLPRYPRALLTDCRWLFVAVTVDLLLRVTLDVGLQLRLYAPRLPLLRVLVAPRLPLRTLDRFAFAAVICPLPRSRTLRIYLYGCYVAIWTDTLFTPRTMPYRLFPLPRLR